MEPFEQIYSSYLKDVYQYVFSLCRDPAEAEEITQETFYQALKSMPTFRGDCKLIVWLCQIAKHSYFARLKKRSEQLHCRRKSCFPRFRAILPVCPRSSGFWRMRMLWQSTGICIPWRSLIKRYSC